MNLTIVLSAIYTALDVLHDYILHPIFKDQPDGKQLDKILVELKSLEKQVQELKQSKK